MCEYCDNHIIDVESRPSDKLAVLTDENKWKCGTCVQEQLDNDFMNTAPYSDLQRYKEIKEKRKREETTKRQLEDIHRLVDAVNKTSNKHKWKVIK